MAPQTPIGVPAQLVSGDTLLFQATYPDFPSSEGWSLSLAILGVGELKSTAGEVTDDGASTYTFTIAATRTAALDAGNYRWFVYATGSGTYANQRYRVAEGRIEIRPNPATAAAGDLQAQCEKDLTAIESVIAGRITDDLQAYTIAGRQIVALPISDLLRLRSQLRMQVYRLRHPGRAMPSVRVVAHGLY